LQNLEHHPILHYLDNIKRNKFLIKNILSKECKINSKDKFIYFI